MTNLDQYEWFGLFMSLLFHSDTRTDEEAFIASQKDAPEDEPTRQRYAYNRGWREMRDVIYPD